MPRPKGKKVAARLSVGLSQPQYAALTALAEQNEATVAWLIRRAVAEFLERHGPSALSALRLPRRTAKLGPRASVRPKYKTGDK
jgi:hypothetical protein